MRLSACLGDLCFTVNDLYDGNVGCRPHGGAGAYMLTPGFPAVIKMRFSVCSERNVFQEVFLTVTCSDIMLLKGCIST